CCSHVPITESPWPMKNRRKFRCRSARNVREIAKLMARFAMTVRLGTGTRRLDASARQARELGPQLVERRPAACESRALLLDDLRRRPRHELLVGELGGEIADFRLDARDFLAQPLPLGRDIDFDVQH